MKVILKQDVKGLGKNEQMIDVSDGYARNFLLPKKLAVEANATNMNIMKSRKDAESTKKEREFLHAKELASKISSISLKIKAKAGENGKLFGSITAGNIADKLKTDFNIEIDKRKIVMHDAIKSLGTNILEVRLYPEVIVKLEVKVEASA